MARAAFLLAAAAYAAVVVVSALVLPERVPVHFGPGGRADAYDDRTVALAVDALVGLGVTGLVAGLAAWVARLPPERVNVPNAAFWRAPENTAELRRRLRADLHAFGAATLLLLACLIGLATRAAATGTDRMPGAAWVLLGGYVVAVLGGALWALTGRYAVPATAERGHRASR